MKLEPHSTIDIKPLEARFVPHRVIGQITFASVSLAFVAFMLLTGHHAVAAVVALAAMLALGWPLGDDAQAQASAQVRRCGHCKTSTSRSHRV